VQAKEGGDFDGGHVVILQALEGEASVFEPGDEVLA
jgi:hypothetical protein